MNAWIFIIQSSRKNIMSAEMIGKIMTIVDVNIFVWYLIAFLYPTGYLRRKVQGTNSGVVPTSDFRTCSIIRSLQLELQSQKLSLKWYVLLDAFDGTWAQSGKWRSWPSWQGEFWMEVCAEFSCGLTAVEEVGWVEAFVESDACEYWYPIEFCPTDDL